jgi:hypothetical protein
MLFLGMRPMTNLLVLIRNLVLATILGWLGMEFTPDNADRDDKPAGNGVIASIFG